MFVFFFKQKTAYEIEYGLVGSEMCIRDRAGGDGAGELPRTFQVNSVAVEVPGLANGGGPESIPLQPGEAEGSFSTERLDSRLQAGSDHVAVTVGFDLFPERTGGAAPDAVSYTHLRAHETVLDLVCRLLLEKKEYRLLIEKNHTEIVRVHL